MKRFILLFAVSVFAALALPSCDGNDSLKPGPHYKVVKIKTKGADSHGNKPLVVPRCVELKFKANQQVKWVIDRDDAVFTIEFKQDESPFEKNVFDNEHNTSGPVTADPGEKDKVYMYSLDVKGLVKLDPAVIIWK